MQSSIWKLGALFGVIGIGFLVLMKAQTGLSVNKGEDPAQEFNELSAIEELDKLDHSESIDNEQETKIVSSDRATQLAALGGDQTDVAPANQSEPAGIVPTPAFDSDASVSDTSNPSTPADSEEESSNPFAAFSFTSDSEAPPQSEPTADETVEPPADSAESSNPFTDLVNSMTESPHASDERAVPNHEVTQAAGTESEGFNPFTIMPEPEPEPESENESVSAAAGTEAASVATFLPEEQQEDPLLPLQEATQQESGTLASLPEGAPGPALMSPPALAPIDEPTPSPAATAAWPAQQAEPAVYETVSEASDAEPASLNEPVPNEIVQVSGEQPADAATGQNPFLAFPGAESPNTDSQPAATAASPAVFPSSADVDSANHPWPGGQTAEVNPPADVVHADGTIEMTIKPRDKQPQIIPTQYWEQETADAADEFNPFPGGQEETPITGETLPPAGEAVRPMPSFDNSKPSMSRVPVEPILEPLPHREPALPQSLTPADYVGVGTVSAETPSTPQQAQLTIQKQAPEGAVLGQDLIYSIMVKNIGHSSAKNVVVEDLVPKGSELKGTDPQAQMTPEKKLVWHLGNMDPGSERTIRIKVVPVKAGQIGSVATVTFEAAVASRTIITAPELQLDMQGPREVRIGEKAPFLFTLSNIGTADASNVFVRSILPAGFRHPAANEKNDIEYEVGLLKRGESRQVELTLLAVSEGDFQNHAILSADGDVSVESTQTVKVIPSRIKISREGPSNRFVGREARYTSTLTNESSESLFGLTVTEIVPSGLKFVSASDNGTFNAQQRTVTWQIANLEPGGARRFQTVCVADQPGRLETSIRAQDSRGDRAEAISQTTVAGFSSLTVDVSNPGRPIPVGEELALRLKVRNGGTAAASEVRTSVELPPELRFISVRGPVSYSQQGNRIVFQPIDRIDVESEQTFDVVLAAAQATDDARVIVQLSSHELAKPLSEEESVVIFAEGE